MQVKLFQLVHTQGFYAISDTIGETFNSLVGLHQLGITFSKVSRTDNLILVSADQYHGSTSGISRYGVRPEVKKVPCFALGVVEQGPQVEYN